MAILDTIGVIGTNSLLYQNHEKWIFTIACIVVSWVWFFALAIAGKRVGRFNKNGTILKWINKISAILIWCIAIYMGIKIF